MKDLIAALGGGVGAKPRTVPASVRAVDICWPLGLAAEATPPSQCRLRRAAWTLDGTVPPTLPDRVRAGGLVDTAWVDARHTHRLRPGCAGAAGRLEAMEYARWPALLEPWIGPDLRSEAERIPWSAACPARQPQRALRVSGLENGSVIRAGTGGGPHRPAVVRVQAIGSRDEVNWLLDGRWVGTTAPLNATGLRLTLDQVGDHALTAMDTQGRYERLVFSVR